MHQLPTVKPIHLRQLIIVPNKYLRELGLRAFCPHTLGEGGRPWLESVINSPIASCIVSKSLLSQPGTWTMGRTPDLETVCDLVIITRFNEYYLMATHSSILAWKIPWTEEPGRLQSIASQRVKHDWATSHLKWFLYILSHSNTVRQEPAHSFYRLGNWHRILNNNTKVTKMVSHRVKIWTQAMETPKPTFSMTTLCCLLQKNKRVNPKESTK